MKNDSTPQKMTIVVIADLHYGEDAPGSKRRCSIADILLERAVRRLNRLVRPDVVLVLGDLVDAGEKPGAAERLRSLRIILDKLDCPYLAIPGNHDGDEEQFYRAFDRPKDVVDIAGVRFLPFVDKGEPRYWASRTEVDLNRMRAARAGYDGPLVSLQHVCLFPPGDQPVTPYNYTNAAEVIKVMKEVGVTLSVSGHHHLGGADTGDGSVTFVNAPGLCEAPFPFLEITLDGDRVETRRHELALPADLRFFDNHMHTELAYCSENMTVAKTISIAREFGLAGITFTEHSGQLYFDRKPYWRNDWLDAGIEGADESHNRMPDYLALKHAYEDDFARFSLEADCDARGALVLKSDDVRYFQHLTGTIHALPGLTRETPPSQREIDTFLYLVDAMGRKGIRILAHPMRIFRRLGWDAPDALFEPTAMLLKEHGVAAEINFHTNEPPVKFIRCCLRHGVKFSFGSDAHNLSEIGDFAYHVALLREAGVDGNLADVLVTRD